MPTNSLVVTNHTTIAALQRFLHDKDNASLHGKANKDGSYTLYVSKGGGIGASYLFGVSKRTRQMNARLAILKIIANHERSPKRQEEFAGHFNEFKDFLEKRVPEPTDPSKPKNHIEDSDTPSDRVSSLKNHLIAGSPQDFSGKKHGFKVRHSVGANIVAKKLAPEVANYFEHIPPRMDSDPIRDFNALGLHVENGKVHSFFQEIRDYMNSSPEGRQDLETPAKTEFAKTLERAVFASTMFPGKVSIEYEKLISTATEFIKNNLQGVESPYPLGTEITGILGLAADISRKVNGLNEFIKCGLNEPNKVSYATVELAGLIGDLKKIQFGADLFTNEKFITQVQEDKQAEIRQLGKDLQTLFIEFAEPTGPYQSLYRLGRLAANSPDEFVRNLQTRVVQEQNQLI
jgi:hypothetical protein